MYRIKRSFSGEKLYTNLEENAHRVDIDSEHYTLLVKSLPRVDISFVLVVCCSGQ